MGDADDRRLIEGTIHDIRQAIADTRARRQDLDREILEREDRLRLWETKLAKLGAGPEKQRISNPRAPRGANKRAVDAAFDAKPEKALWAISELARETDLGASSVRAVLTRNEDDYEEVEGQWRRKSSAPALKAVAK